MTTEQMCWLAIRHLDENPANHNPLLHIALRLDELYTEIETLKAELKTLKEADRTRLAEQVAKDVLYQIQVRGLEPL